MLQDDPENGYAGLGLASAWEKQLVVVWKQYVNLKSTTGSAQAEGEVLDEESRLFGATLNSWNKLLDNSRFRRTAFERLASLHCRRSRLRDSDEELDKAVAVLDKMFESGMETSSGIDQRSDMEPLMKHSQYNRLVQAERNISNPNAIRRPPQSRRGPRLPVRTSPRQKKDE